MNIIALKHHVFNQIEIRYHFFYLKKEVLLMFGESNIDVYTMYCM